MATPTNESKSTSVSQDEKLMGAFSYLWVLSLIILVIKRESEYVKFHARQGFVLFIISIIFLWIPGLNVIVGIAYVLASIYGIYNAMMGQKRELPLIGRFAQRINL
jgi:uncharacterized membrane protein